LISAILALVDTQMKHIEKQNDFLEVMTNEKRQVAEQVPRAAGEEIVIAPQASVVPSSDVGQGAVPKKSIVGNAAKAAKLRNLLPRSGKLSTRRELSCLKLFTCVTTRRSGYGP
jgi:hypothetical protein